MIACVRLCRQLTLLWLLSASMPSLGEVLQGMRVHQAPDYTRVVIDSSDPVQFEVFQLDDPQRVVIDLAKARAGSGFSLAGLAGLSNNISTIRSAERGVGYRVVLEVPQKLRPEAFALKPVPPYGHRLVVDLYSKEKKRRPAAPKPREAMRDVVIAIDAGHGGEDPGAIGPGRVREKTVVLGIAQRLKKRFDKAAGYKAVLVRTGDYYIGLKDRRAAARDARADLFLSIHADAFKKPSVSGASVYTLSERGATSETARWLAEKENRSDLIGGVGDVSLNDKDDLLTHVLLDLSMDAKRTTSIEVGESILGALGKVTKLHKARVEQAGFVVLKRPDIPSVLIETGYISNPKEAKRLNQRDHQEKLAGAIFAGITTYMARKPPAGSLLAARSANQGIRHVIARGETLSGIASRYGVSQQTIRKTNALATDRIRIGQVLIIPAG